MISFAVDDAPKPIPTGLKVNEAGAFSFDLFGAGVGVGVALIAPVGVGVGVIEPAEVGVGVGVGLIDPMDVGVGVAVGGATVPAAEGPIFAIKPLTKPW